LPKQRLVDEAAAGNGLLNRRTMLRGGLFAAGIGVAQAADSIGADAPEWMKTPGRSFSGYGMPAKSQDKVQRTFTAGPGRPGTGVSRTPVHLLEGTITPNGLHFERHHNGIPDIDPARHELVIHGMVNRPLAFSVEALMRYPMETHVRFIECPGNSGGYIGPQPTQASAVNKRNPRRLN